MSKPLNHKNYGSIPHLPTSYRTLGDHLCTDGQAKIATTKTRDKHDLIIVTEKLDGSNTGVAKIDGQFLPVTRRGHHANLSPYWFHHKFAAWVNQNYERFDSVLSEGERLVGEWLLQPHDTIYELAHEPWVLIDAFGSPNRRKLWSEITLIAEVGGFVLPHVLHHDFAPFDPVNLLRQKSGHGAEQPEGAVWRVEREGKVDFLVKWVRPGFEPGKYLEEVNDA